jgi:hypothetical protein
MWYTKARAVLASHWHSAADTHACLSAGLLAHLQPLCDAGVHDVQQQHHNTPPPVLSQLQSHECSQGILCLVLAEWLVLAESTSTSPLTCSLFVMPECMMCSSSTTTPRPLSSAVVLQSWPPWQQYASCTNAALRGGLPFTNVGFHSTSKPITLGGPAAIICLHRLGSQSVVRRFNQVDACKLQLSLEP